MAWTDPPRTWLAGEDPPASTYNTHIRDQFKAIGDAWTAYTPTWTTSGVAPALGNGTLTGVYMRAGKFVTFRLRWVPGSTTTFGTGEFRFTYPVTALTAANPDISGYVFRSGPTYWGIQAVGFGTSSFRMIGTAANGLVTGTSPTTFDDATSDEINIGGTYEAA